MVKQKNFIKKECTFIVLCLFFASMLFGQAENKRDKGPVISMSCGEVDVWVDEIIWDADYEILMDIMEQEELTSPFPIIEGIVPDLAPYNAQMFHIAVLKFGNSTLATNHTFRFDILSDLTYGSDKPIYYVYSHDGFVTSASLLGNYRIRFELTQTNSLNKGGGVITTIGAMGRSATFLKSDTDCMTLRVTDRLSNDNYNCMLGNDYSIVCALSSSSSKVDTDNTISLTTYPNPVQDQLFVETSELNVKSIHLLNLQGQSLNHQVNITPAEGKWQINTNELEVGMYILQVETDTGTSVKKIYIQ